MLLGEVTGDLVQVGVGKMIKQVSHQWILAPAVAEIGELVEQIALRLAGDARIKAVAGGAAFLAVAGGAGDDAPGHRIRQCLWRWRLRLCAW